MKKIILSVLVVTMVVVLGVGLTACNNATPQGQLSNLLNTHKHEVFEYDVIERDVKNDTYTSRGSYTVALDAFKKDASVSFGTRTLEHVSEGIRVSGKLVSDDIIYETGCYYNLISGTSFMVPAYSFMTITKGGNITYQMQGTYDGSTFKCDRTVGDKEYKNEAVKLSGTVFDNNQVHQILRAIPSSTFSGGMSLTFSAPIARENEFAGATFTASGNGTAKIKTAYTNGVEALMDEGINCYRISYGRQTEVKSMSHTLYYAVDEVKANGWGLKNILVKIIEPFTDSDRNLFEMHYELKSVAII